MHLIVGLYLAEICMIGLFALQSAVVPVVLMVLFLIFTCLVHISINDAVSPLLYNLPRTLALQDKELSEDVEDEYTPQDTTGLPDTRSDPVGGAASDYYNLEEGLPGETNTNTHPSRRTTEDEHPSSDRAVEGASGLASSIKDWFLSRAKERVISTLESDLKADTQPSAFTRILTTLNHYFTPDSTRKPNMLVRWLHPEIFDDFHVLRKMFPDSDAASHRSLSDLKTETAEAEDEKEREEKEVSRRGYLPPEMWTPCPTIWMPHDEARVSKQEVDHCRQVVGVSASDRGAWLDARGIVRVEEDVQIGEKRLRY